MPFDAMQPAALVPTKPHRPDLRYLAYALRHPEVWPANFKSYGWDYRRLAHCAVGLAHALWPWRLPPYFLTVFGITGFRMPLHKFEQIFEAAHRHYRMPSRYHVGPHHVANLLDDYLKS